MSPAPGSPRRADLVVVGAGPAGLSTALFAARRGFRVDLLERDPERPPAGPADAVFAGWRRPGLAQARHSHKFLGLSCQILAEEAPDVLTALEAAGVRRVSISRFGSVDDAEFALAARRLVYEAVLRRAVQAQPGVRVLAGRSARALRLETRAGRSVVRGVDTDDGPLEADLVVDASGRRGGLYRRTPGLELPAPDVQPCGFVYMTRHYRLRPGQELPPLDRPLAHNLGYGAVLAFPADNGTFSLSLTLSVHDPLRRSLLRPDVWDRFVAEVPHTARWAAHGVPEGRVEVLSGIADSWQRLSVDGADPVVGGLLLVGDTCLQSNPTYGRGVSLAIAQGRQAARLAHLAADDPHAVTAAYETFSQDVLGPWHRAQTAADAAALDLMEAGLRAERPRPPDPFQQLMGAVEAVAAHDPLVARALGRMAHLLITPRELIADGEVVRRAVAHLRSGRTGPPPAPADQPLADQGLGRARFEVIAAG